MDDFTLSQKNHIGKVDNLNLTANEKVELYATYRLRVDKNADEN